MCRENCGDLIGALCLESPGRSQQQQNQHWWFDDQGEETQLHMWSLGHLDRCLMTTMVFSFGVFLEGHISRHSLGNVLTCSLPSTLRCEGTMTHFIF